MAIAGFSDYVTTNAAGSFNVTTEGYVQGMELDQPAITFSLRAGVLGPNETIPMWGGVGISASITPPTGTNPPLGTLGNVITRASTIASGAAGQLIGFSVFSGNFSAVNWPASAVPMVGNGGQVNYYLTGSGALVPVACDPNLAAIEGSVMTTPVSWDFVNQQLIPYSSTTISSGTYTSGTGAVSLTTAAAHDLLPGDQFILSAVTGTGSYAQLDGQWTATAGTTGTTLNFTAATGLTLTITGGTVSTGGILPVKVIDFNIGNSMTVTYNSVTGTANWNRSGSCALIQI